MSNSVPSLGDETKKSVLVHEERPLPGNRRELISAFEGILSLGGVQKVVVELGRPIKISRYVKDRLEDPKSIKEEDAFSNVRNAEMQEFVLPEEVPLTDYLFKAFQVLSQKRLRARAFLVRDLALLRKCLDVNMLWDLSELYGVEVLVSEAMPEDVLLLAATRHGEEDIVLSLRMLLSATER